MKKSFPGFYHPSNEDLDKAWQSEKTLFVFDTNTLLNLYGYATLTKDDFFLIIDQIASKIWIPYHVALEYQRRRLEVVKDEKAIFSNIRSKLDKIDTVFTQDIKNLEIHRRLPDLDKRTTKLHSDIKRLIKNYKNSVAQYDKKQPCVRSHDEIRDKLNSIFENKIGPIPEDQKWLDAIFKEGEKRYKNKLPPGFKDDEKSAHNNEFSYSGLDYQRKFGDLIIWKQIINKAKEDNVESVIFVTDDAKKDWWYILDSNGEKVVGPRAELREEIHHESSINLFTIYNTADFLENGKRVFNLSVSDESISDAENKFTNKLKDHVHFMTTTGYSAVKKHQEHIQNNWRTLGHINEMINSKEFLTHLNDIQKSINSGQYQQAIDHINYLQMRKGHWELNNQLPKNIPTQDNTDDED